MAPIQRNRRRARSRRSDLDGAEHETADQPAEGRRTEGVDVAGDSPRRHTGQREPHEGPQPPGPPLGLVLMAISAYPSVHEQLCSLVAMVRGRHDAPLTPAHLPVSCRQRSVRLSGHAGQVNSDGVDAMIRSAIGGDVDAGSWVVAHADTIDHAVLIAMAALLERLPARLDRAAAVAATSRDRQVVAIARAHLTQDRELVDALARDHLVDHPDSLIVAWIAADAVGRARGAEGL